MDILDNQHKTYKIRKNKYTKIYKFYKFSVSRAKKGK